MKIKMVNINQVKPYFNNPRCDDGDKAFEKTKGSLKEFGWRQPIVVDVDMVIIVGHTRWRAALSLSMTEVPIHMATDLTPEQVKAYRIADNKTGEIATWDIDKLRVELAELDETGFSLFTLGFDDDELNNLLDISGVSTIDIDDAPELPDVAVSTLGSIYQLGDHRLMCDDSLDMANIRKLTNNERAVLGFTDPPYNMNYQSKNLGGIKNDRMSEAKFVSFILRSTAVLREAISANASYYICMSAAEYPTVYHQLRKLGMSGRQIIWRKPSAGLGGQEYRPQYEVMLYGYLGKRKSRTWNAARRESDIWEFNHEQPFITRKENGSTIIEIGDGIETTQICIDGKVSGSAITFSGDSSDIWAFSRPSGEYVHPTQKPIALVERAVKNSSHFGDMVLDIFGGSGSTLITCEKLGRRACLMELDPKYCDVIRQRYAEYVHGLGCDWQTLTPEVK